MLLGCLPLFVGTSSCDAAAAVAVDLAEIQSDTPVEVAGWLGGRKLLAVVVLIEAVGRQI